MKKMIDDWMPDYGYNFEDPLWFMCQQIRGFGEVWRKHSKVLGLGSFMKSKGMNGLKHMEVKKQLVQQCPSVPVNPNLYHLWWHNEFLPRLDNIYQDIIYKESLK